jgi:hypothetical protein
MKTLSREQIEKRKAQAVRFAETVLHDSDLADEIAGESLEEYAEHKRIQIIQNPVRRFRMATSKRGLEDRIAELEDQNAELEDENEDLNDRLDQVADLVEVEEEEEEETVQNRPNRRR